MAETVCIRTSWLPPVYKGLAFTENGCKGENQEQWLLLQAVLSLISVCEDFDRQLPDHSRSQDAVIDYYISSLREVDRR